MRTLGKVLNGSDTSPVSNSSREFVLCSRVGCEKALSIWRKAQNNWCEACIAEKQASSIPDGGRS